MAREEGWVWGSGSVWDGELRLGFGFVDGVGWGWDMGSGMGKKGKTFRESLGTGTGGALRMIPLERANCSSFSGRRRSGTPAGTVRGVCVCGLVCTTRRR